ncbi:MAG: polysaccharide deacetylase family protein [Pseudomonadota bacterium]
MCRWFVSIPVIVIVIVSLVMGGLENARAASNWPQPALGTSASGGPEVLFTFDDGPHEKYTPMVLDALRAHRVRAVFFVAGWRLADGADHSEREQIVKQLLAERHMVGNHTYHHAHLCSMTEERAAWEIDQTARLLGRVARLEVPYFRTPYGSRCQKLERLLAQREINHIHWDIDAREYLHHDSNLTRLHVISRIARLEGRAVVLMHDTQLSTARALPGVLAWIEAENLRRQASGSARTIRIISYADVEKERLARPLAKIVSDFGQAAQRLLPTIANRLVSPVVGRQLVAEGR